MSTHGKGQAAIGGWRQFGLYLFGQCGSRRARESLPRRQGDVDRFRSNVISAHDPPIAIFGGFQCTDNECLRRCPDARSRPRQRPWVNGGGHRPQGRSESIRLSKGIPPLTIVRNNGICVGVLSDHLRARRGERVYHLHGESIAIAEVVRVIEEACPAAKGLVSHAEPAMPFADALDDAGYRRDLGPAPRTSFAEGVRKTLDEFARLQKDGRLDARELG